MLHTSLARMKTMAFLSDDNDFEDDDCYTDEHIPLWPIIVIYVMAFLQIALIILVFNS